MPHNANSQNRVRFLSVTPMTLEEESTFFNGDGFGSGARHYLGRKLKQMYESSMETPWPKAVQELMTRLNQYEGMTFTPQPMPEMAVVRVRK